jgi:hypothetical protein
MASAFAATSMVGLMAPPTGNKPSSLSSVPSISSTNRPRNVRLQKRSNFRVKAAKELYFNKDGSAIKKLQVSFKFPGSPISAYWRALFEANYCFCIFRLESTSLPTLLELHWDQREGMLFWRASMGPLRLLMTVLQLQKRYIAKFYHVK